MDKITEDLIKQIAEGETVIANQRESRTKLRGDLAKAEKELDRLLLAQEAVVGFLVNQLRRCA